MCLAMVVVVKRCDVISMRLLRTIKHRVHMLDPDMVNKGDVRQKRWNITKGIVLQSRSYLLYTWLVPGIWYTYRC